MDDIHQEEPAITDSAMFVNGTTNEQHFTFTSDRHKGYLAL